MNYDIPIAVGFFVVILAVGILAVRELFKRAHRTPPTLEVREQRPSQSVPPVGENGEPVAFCVCGARATEPSPTLERGRGSVLRDLMGLPPTYRRVVKHGSPPVWCRAHGHVADALLAEFVASEIRAAFTRAYASVATRAAAFETEELPRRVGESLTDAQRRAGKVRGMGVVRAIRNGTDDTTVGGDV